ncbi:glycosyl transferase [Geoanaerobacter pelophilus]|uniref:Glycosyl transferase n=1 Tax=Geoanaerobacter pelophilus TaxID=60036 RepID=A0ABQ0MFF8_9BACT|nr:glycosyltransferase family 4 protein [Geoanaerobacter pelophilus]GAW65839.1 glycosyl transferase [Geoanaerobacter pelophilus]
MSRILVVGSLAESLINFRGPLLAALVANGHEVHAAAPDASASVKERLAGLGVRYHDLFLARTGLNPLADLKTYRSLKAIIRQTNPEVFFAYTIKPVIYGAFAARAARVPGIYPMITGLGYTFSGLTLKAKLVGSVTSILYRLALSFANQVFFQNPDDMSLFIKRGLISSRAQAVIVNGSGVDLEKFAPANLPQDLSFLLVARLLKDKGVLEYVAAAREIKGRYPQVRFKMAGWIDDNPMAVSTQELVGWQQEGTIEYLGRLEDVRPAFAECSVYVLPSYREGTPRTVLEAMAMGRAIVTTDAPGCRETVVDGENGFLVTVKDSETLAKAMEKFIVDQGLIKIMGDRSRDIAENKYDVNKVNHMIMTTMGLVDEKSN